MASDFFHLHEYDSADFSQPDTDVAYNSDSNSSESDFDANNDSSSGTYSGGVSSIPSSLPYSNGSYTLLANDNVLREVINDEQYFSLRKLGVLNEKVLRDFHIRKTFRELRAQHLSAHQAIERLQSLYPYLQFDTLRKIVYQINDKS